MIARDVIARSDAINHYVDRYEDFCETAQTIAGVPGGLSMECSVVAFRFLTAAEAEQQDPEPRFDPDCLCPAHVRYRSIPSEQKGPHPMESMHA